MNSVPQIQQRSRVGGDPVGANSFAKGPVRSLHMCLAHHRLAEGIRSHRFSSVRGMAMILWERIHSPKGRHLMQWTSGWIGIISAYTAKEYCSCRYVMLNSAEYCRGYVKQYVPSSVLDDAANKRVTAEGLGRSNVATWQGERQGCRLLPSAP